VASIGPVKWIMREPKKDGSEVSQAYAGSD
jgi:hypothetical protein